MVRCGYDYDDIKQHGLSVDCTEGTGSVNAIDVYNNTENMQYHYIGCYADSASDRALGHQSFTSPVFSIKTCHMECFRESGQKKNQAGNEWIRDKYGYAYFALQLEANGDVNCFCSNDLSLAIKHGKEDDCDHGMGGYGDLRISLYRDLFGLTL